MAVCLFPYFSEHRYGREEMLALFSTFKGVPEELYDYPTILSEAPLKPVSFLPFSGEFLLFFTLNVSKCCSGDCIVEKKKSTSNELFFFSDDEQRLISNSVNSQVSLNQIYQQEFRSVEMEGVAWNRKKTVSMSSSIFICFFFAISFL